MDMRRTRRKGGFSLIELLAAVAILMMIVSMMAMLFGETNRSWKLGTDRAENNNTGRAALQLLTHDLQYAVADHVLSFALFGETTNTYASVADAGTQFGCDELRFVSLKHDSLDKKRTAREVFYYISSYYYRNTPFPYRYALMRGELTNVSEDRHCYKEPKWYDEQTGVKRPSENISAVVAENVAAFAVFVPDPDPAANGELVREYFSDKDLVTETQVDRWTTIAETNKLDRLPAYADVFLEILDDTAAKQLSEMFERGIKPKEHGKEISYAMFIEKNSRRYATRVHFHNGHGYQDALRMSKIRKPAGG